jgi:hypothetical protein
MTCMGHSTFNNHANAYCSFTSATLKALKILSGHLSTQNLSVLMRNLVKRPDITPGLIYLQHVTQYLLVPVTWPLSFQMFRNVVSKAKVRGAEMQ